MFRYKQLLNPKITLRDYNAQVGEALANMKVMNKVIKTKYAYSLADKLKL
ncbi:Mobile element protein (plasmid) [Candidatus Enterovibrio escicola]|uniref:Mobile element protein n=1 Tax=Candidatus Enterovibrio escicola TaxID=1927127 RepID=A0A2A5T759_9GAMM|nr:Mobile element protein [Candidatus Enterovibrio escacola]